MLVLAMKMLIGNRASCLGIIYGVFLSTLLISQQSAIFLGLLDRSYRFVNDNPLPDIWVIDPTTESVEKVRSIPEKYIETVSSTPGILWAVGLNVAQLPMTTPSGLFDTCILYGIDDTTLIGAPQHIIKGRLEDLRRPRSIIVDAASAETSLAITDSNGQKRALQVGDSLEINEQNALVVGLCQISRGFYPQPTIFTTNSSFNLFTSHTQRRVEFIAAKAKPEADLAAIIDSIRERMPLDALTRPQLEWRIAKSFLQTGILINFGLSVALGIIIGFTIAGQVFYIMTLQNIAHFALIKAVGGDHNLLTKMVVVQVFSIGLIGYLLGTGATLLWGYAVKETTLAFLFPWQLLVFTGTIVFIICLFTVGLSLRKIYSTDAKMLMGG